MVKWGYLPLNFSQNIRLLQLPPLLSNRTADKSFYRRNNTGTRRGYRFHGEGVYGITKVTGILSRVLFLPLRFIKVILMTAMIGG